MTGIIKTFVALLMFTTTPNTQVEILNHLEHHHAYIAMQVYEGYAEHNDIYIVELADRSFYAVKSDDLKAGDPVTVWFFQGEPVRTMYNWR